MLRIKGSQSSAGRRPANWLVLTAICLAACDDTTNGIDSEPGQPVILAVAELTFRDIGEPHMSASVLVAPSIAALEQQRADGSGGNAAITFQPLAVGFLDHIAATVERRRFVHAIFNVRNVFDSTAAAAAQNVTLVALSTANTISGTPFRVILRADRSAVPASFAGRVRAAGIARHDQDGNVQVDSAHVLRILSTAELRDLTRTAGVTEVFPFGFQVNRAVHLTLVDGIVSAGFVLPLLEQIADNPATLSILLLAFRTQH